MVGFAEVAKSCCKDDVMIYFGKMGVELLQSRANEKMGTVGPAVIIHVHIHARTRATVAQPKHTSLFIL